MDIEPSDLQIFSPKYRHRQYRMVLPVNLMRTHVLCEKANPLAFEQTVRKSNSYYLTQPLQ